MQPYRADRVVRALTTLVSIAYYLLLVGAAIGVLLPPALKLFAGGSSEWTIGLQAQGTVRDSATVQTSWGRGQLLVEDVRVDLKLPGGMLPWWLVAVIWAHFTLYSSLLLLSAHQLRMIFKRVRDGAAFDVQNAVRMRRLGLLLLAFALYNGVAEFVTSMAVRNRVTSDSITVSTGFHVNALVVFTALVLVALAEIFRRGAELEHEQSLVV